VSVITPIDLDHVSILGPSVAKIAGEKAGIIKEGVPVVMAPQTLEAETVLRAVAAENNAPLFEVGKDFEFDRGESDLNGQQVQVKHAGVDTKLYIAFLGAHQAANAATAFAALTVANERGLAVEGRSIIEGFAKARWSGRFEVLQSDPQVVLDAAHSPHAARALAAALDEYFPGCKAVLVLGVSADKDVSGIIEALRPSISRAIATQSAHPRAMAAGVLAESLLALGIQADGEPDPVKALRDALRLVGSDELVLACGSVFLVEQVREALFRS
jgi:dihydrofolate synthase/folylpolyglutamate synthase